MVSPKISVVVPVYNAEEFLSHTLSMLAGQSLQDIEILIIDDGSSDSSPKILHDFAATDARIKLFQQSNCGVSVARNKGIEKSTGDFITFLDSDDFYGNDRYLETLYLDATRNNQLISGASFVNYRSSEYVEDDFSQSPFYCGYTFNDNKLINYNEYQFDYGFHRFIFHKSLFSNGQNRFCNLSFYEDPVFLVKIMHQAKSFFACSDAQYFYRAESSQRLWDTNKILALMEGVRMNMQFAHSENLALLYWYTLNHFNKESGACEVGANRRVNLRIVDESLNEIEQEFDANLYSSGARDSGFCTSAEDLLFNFDLRQVINDYTKLPYHTKLRRRAGFELRKLGLR